MKKILWVVEKQFDISPDTATWLEMVANLQAHYNVHLLSGYRKLKIQPKLIRNKIWYYESSNIPVINRLTTYLSQNHAFSSKIQSFRPDVVLFNVSNPWLLKRAVSFQKNCGIKLVLDVRTLPVSPEKTKCYIDQKILGLNLRYAAKKFDGVTYITEEMRRFCISEYALTPHLSAIWTSGVNIDLFTPKFLKDDNNVFRLLYHGTIAKNRGLDNIVRALSMLRNVDIRMEFLGKGDGVDELKSLARRLGVFDKISFLSPVNYRDVPDSINLVHAGILPFPDWPAWNTSSPIKLFEYLSCGKPVIVTDIPAHRSVIGNGNFAFWANGNSTEALSRAICRANDERPTFEELGRAARQFVTEQYTWRQQARNLRNFIEQILTMKP